MKVVAYYSFNGGKDYIEENFRDSLNQVFAVIGAVDAFACKTKESREKAMAGNMLFNPHCMNLAFKLEFGRFGWTNHREGCSYVYGTYLDGYVPPSTKSGASPFRDMDFVRSDVKPGVEVQFGKYAPMVYDVCAKITIFHNFGIIDAGIEIVPTKHLAEEMSSGVSCFEQISWDLEKRGTADIDVPVLILGIDA